MTTEFAVLLSFVVFVLLVIYIGGHKKVAEGLDKRSAAIAHDLAEARRLREEAEALLASYKAKALQAEKDAADIVAQAQAEAEALASEAAARTSEFVTRRTKQAEQKIAQAEQQAMAEVRAAAADAAVRAAETILRQDVRGPAAASLVDDSISRLRSVLN